MPAPISFRDEIDALMVTGAPMNENQATPVVTNEQELFERIADKCDALNDSYNTLDENKANRGEVFSKDEVDAMPTDGSSNLVTSGGIAKSLGQLSPRWGVSAEKTVLTFSDGSRQLLDVSGALTASLLPDISNLTGVYLGTTVSSIGDNAFRYCTTLKVVECSNVVSIGQQAFANCPALEVIDFGNSLLAVPTATNNSFTNLPEKCSFVVPDSIAEDWKDAPIWSSAELSSKVVSQEDWQYVRKKDLFDIARYLGPIRELSLIGSADYELEDLRTRLDVIITTLKSIGGGKFPALDDIDPIGEGDYEIDDLKNRLDTLLTALKAV